MRTAQSFWRVLALVLLVGALWWLDLAQLPGLNQLRDGRDALRALVQEQPLASAALYFGIYLAVAALSIPGAAVLTLAGGALFGFGAGLLLVSFASSIGATLAFLASRHLLREGVQRRWGSRLAAIHRGLEREGAWYLLSLRLLPVVPFVAVNLAMGLTRMKTATFYLVSQLGMLTGTAVYVAAGTELAQLESVADVLSGRMLASFALLALLALAAPRGLARWRSRRVYARWKHLRPRRFDCNLVVIGAGAGGLVSAYVGAAVKARVTLVEAAAMGGDCLHHGCIPSKALIRSATLAHQMRNASRYGLDDHEPAPRLPALMRRQQQVVASVAPNDSAQRYTAMGVEVLAGHATIVNPWTVEVRLADGGVQRRSTRAIVIAAGAAPVLPDLPGLAQVGCLSSDTLWDALAGMQALPRRMLVLGGGPMGCEMAQCLQRLGAQVTLAEAGPRLLPREDAEVSALTAASLTADGVRVLCGHRALRFARAAAGEDGAEGAGRKTGVLAHPAGELEVVFDALLCATGRAARLSGYGLEELGIAVDAPLQTDECLQTLFPNIYAAGDVVGPFQLTHAAAHQAWYATVNALFGGLRRFAVDYSVIPRAIFVDPEVARVGLNEQEALAQGVAFELLRLPMERLDRAVTDAQTQGFVKLLTAAGTDRILGVTIVGAHAGDLLAEFALAMRHGLGLRKILATVHSYPTFSEAGRIAAGEWMRAHQPRRMLAWAERYHRFMRGG